MYTTSWCTSLWRLFPRYSLLLSALTCLILTGCETDTASPSRFSALDPATTGIAFANRITENDTFNILNLEYVYNGGGVGVGDFNGDGRPDLYFTGNTAANAMYLNRGDWKFDDVTTAAGVAADNRWSAGVAVADINADGIDDIYVACTVLEPGGRRANQLFVSTSVDTATGVASFSESATAYGIADTSHSTTAAWLDYDLDGDLDLYVLVNHMDDKRLPNRYRPKVTDGSGTRTDKLYRNDGSPTEPRFTEVGKQAGILKDGYGLGVAVCDINADGWPDLYITNDYLSNDLAWVNQRDGTFIDAAEQITGHTSYSAMGVDVADLNRDGLPDIVTLDMLPATNERRKTMMPAANYNAERNNASFGYQRQYMRNMLQLNRGPLRPTDTLPVFSDIGAYAGVAATDWSWSVLAVDVDLDADQDLLVTNGFPRDVTDLDFMDYQSELSRFSSPEHLLSQIPQVKLSNLAFANDGAAIPRFADVTQDWGLDLPSYSSGAATVDLDGDGDLDYVVNRINDSALVYRNETISATALEARPPHYVTIELLGPPGNSHAYGATVDVHSGGRLQRQYQSPFRGYLSSVSSQLTFGTGAEVADSIVVVWPGGARTLLDQPASDTLVQLSWPGASSSPAFAKTSPTPDTGALVKDVTSQLSLDYRHEEDLFVDFDYQRLLPRQLSQYGPALAVGDVNGDGYDDVFVGGSARRQHSVIMGTGEGFAQPTAFGAVPTIAREATGALFFDADGDGDEDLYVANGGTEALAGEVAYADEFYRNTAGVLTPDPQAVPGVLVSSSCVRAADIDGDGDLDLFVGARAVPLQFPLPGRSRLLLNDGSGSFTETNAPWLTSLGMVTDAVLIDLNGDAWVDLLLTEDFGKVRYFKGSEAGFSESEIAALNGKSGCWNGLHLIDIDRDGDLDVVVANLGRNTLFSRADGELLRIYAGDFDANGTIDAIPATRFTNAAGGIGEYPYFHRKESQNQLARLKGDFPKHVDFANTDAPQLIQTLGGADTATVAANYFASVVLENLGNSNFALHELPVDAQLAPIYGISHTDLDGDGHTDLLLTGNEYGIEVAFGRMDALYGVVLKGDGALGFKAVSLAKAGFIVPGDATALVQLAIDGQLVWLSAENQGPLRAFAKTALTVVGIEQLSSDDHRTVVQQNGAAVATPFGMGHGASSARIVNP